MESIRSCSFYWMTPFFVEDTDFSAIYRLRKSACKGTGLQGLIVLRDWIDTEKQAYVDEFYFCVLLQSSTGMNN